MAGWSTEIRSVDGFIEKRGLFKQVTARSRHRSPHSILDPSPDFRRVAFLPFRTQHDAFFLSGLFSLTLDLSIVLIQPTMATTCHHPYLPSSQYGNSMCQCARPALCDTDPSPSRPIHLFPFRLPPIQLYSSFGHFKQNDFMCVLTLYVVALNHLTQFGIFSTHPYLSHT